MSSGSAERIRAAFWLNLIFTFIELVGGWWTGSVAVLADAIHDLGDSLALGLAYHLEKKAGEGPSRDFSYGMKRLSLLSAVISGLVLVAGSVWIGVEAVERLLAPTVSPPFGLGMMGLALLGLSVNGFAAWRLLSGRTMNERMLSWHLIEDVMGWAAVLIGALFIHFAGWVWLDPVLALLIAGFVSYNAFRNLVQVSLVFLQRIPQGFDRRNLKAELLSIAGVEGVHDLHVWSLDGQNHVVSMHAVVKAGADVGRIKKDIRHLTAHHGSVHTTIETESALEACFEDCDRPGGDD